MLFISNKNQVLMFIFKKTNFSFYFLFEFLKILNLTNIYL
jgi:hypothetical protein